MMTAIGTHSGAQEGTHALLTPSLQNAAVSPGDWDSCSGQGHTAVAEGDDEIARGAMAEILLEWVLQENATADKVLTVDKSLNF